MKNTDEDSILLGCIRQFFRKCHGGNQEDSLTTAPTRVDVPKHTGDLITPDITYLVHIKLVTN